MKYMNHVQLYCSVEGSHGSPDAQDAGSLPSPADSPPASPQPESPDVGDSPALPTSPTGQADAPDTQVHHWACSSSHEKECRVCLMHPFYFKLMEFFDQFIIGKHVAYANFVLWLTDNFSLCLMYGNVLDYQQNQFIYIFRSVSNKDIVNFKPESI